MNRFVFAVLSLQGANLLAAFAIAAGGLGAKAAAALLFAVSVWIFTWIAFIESRTSANVIDTRTLVGAIAGALVLYSVCNTVIHFVFGRGSLADAFLLSSGYWTWAAPAFVFLGATQWVWRSLIAAAKYLVFIGCILFFIPLLTLDDAVPMTEIWAREVLAPVFLLFLLFYALSGREKFLVALGFIFLIVCALATTRRYLLLHCALTVIAVFAVGLRFYGLSTMVRQTSGLIPAVVATSLLVAGLLYITGGAVGADSVSALSEKLLVNSREGLVDDFLDDMSAKDLFFGRGVWGFYESSLIVTDKDAAFLQTGLRFSIEIGWLHIVFKMGLLYAIGVLCLIILSLKNVYNHPASLSLCAFIVIKALMMLVFGLPAFGFEWITLFLSIGALSMRRDHFERVFLQGDIYYANIR